MLAGMPPHNNNTKREMRDVAMSQRNARHKTVALEGRDTLSVLPAVTRTCNRHGLSPARALPGHLLDRKWDMFGRARDMPFSLVSHDGTGNGVPGAPGPLPEPRGPVAACSTRPARAACSACAPCRCRMRGQAGRDGVSPPHHPC